MVKTRQNSRIYRSAVLLRLKALEKLDLSVWPSLRATLENNRLVLSRYTIAASFLTPALLSPSEPILKIVACVDIYSGVRASDGNNRVGVGQQNFLGAAIATELPQI